MPQGKHVDEDFFKTESSEMLQAIVKNKIR